LPFFPISIHVTNSGQILVCVVESVGGVNLFYENRETNIRQIMKYTAIPVGSNGLLAF
jgi:hypothetical protein